MKQRTLILGYLIDAAHALDAMQDALTKAYVVLEGRHGDEAQEAFQAVREARDESYEERLADLIEGAITITGRMA